MLTGAHGLAGVSAALYHRERTGQGQKIEVSLIDCLHDLPRDQHRGVVGVGRILRGDPLGSLHRLVPGYGVFATRDGDVMIGVGNDRQWAQLCRAMGRPELTDDERYATIPSG